MTTLATRRRSPSRSARRAVAQRSFVPALLGLLSLAVAFAQRPGDAYTDTRIELTTAAADFVERVSSVWTSTFDPGHIESAQFVGYVFPMGAWFALADLAGLPVWVAERLWLGGLMFLAAWGVVRLMDELYSPERGVAHLGAGLLYAFNPYVVVYVSRGSVVLIAYAALPWLLVATQRGLRDPRGWRAPAALGLVLTASAAGTNAVVVFWVALAAVLLLAFHWLVLRRALADVWAFAWRAGAFALVGALWWLIPVALQTLYGSDFLDFTEQPSAIFATPSMSESLRLLGLWVVYLGSGYGELEPQVSVAATYLFDKPVIVGSFLVPLLALGGLRYTRRWPYAAFFGLLAGFALVVMAAGFPDGTPLRRVIDWGYYNVESGRIFRTAYKAAPLLALAVACLGGAAAHALVERARQGRIVLGEWRVPVWALAVLCALPLLAAAPLFKGDAVDERIAYGDVPAGWEDALRDSDRSSPPGRRVMLLPGQMFAFYRWGNTGTSVAPGLSERPLLIREVTRYADPRAAQLQDVVDDLVQQARLVPGQLAPLLELLGVGEVIVAADAQVSRSGALEPARVEQALEAQPGFERPLASYGPVRRHRPARGRGGEPRLLPDLRRFDAPPGDGAGIVRVRSGEGPMLLEGDASGVAALAATGGLAPERALFYSADTDRGELRSRLAEGAQLVFTDSNRRRVLEASRTSHNHSHTLTAGEPIFREWPLYDLFGAGKGPEGRTVAVYDGLRSLYAPTRPGFEIYPQYRPYAALDGRPETSWLSSSSERSDRYLELTLERPRAIGALRIRPHADAAGVTAVMSMTVNDRRKQPLLLRRGWNRVPVRERAVSKLRFDVLGVRGPPFPGAGGIAEIDIPGLRVTESLRLPGRLAAASAGQDLARNDVVVLLERSSTDFPTRAGAEMGNPQSGSPLDAVDPEPGIERELSLPAARSYSVDGWASVAPDAPDHGIDRLAGLAPGWRYSSSSRFEGAPARRASSAFDGDRGTAWVGDWFPFETPPWLSVRAPRPFTVERLRLVPGPAEYAAPQRVRVETPLGFTRPLRVARDGGVELPRRLRTRSLRVHVESLRTRSPEGRRRRLRAVAIGELELPGLRPARPRRSGPFESGCGELSARGGGSSAPLRVRGAVEDLDRGSPLRVESCERLELSGGGEHLSAPPGRVMRPDHLRLLSLAPAGARTPAAPGRVADQGSADGGRRDGVRLELTRPGWLVLGESYSRGWRAWCKDASGSERSLGEPEPADGYANGWRVTPDCVEARFGFAPGQLASAGYALSLAGVLAMLAVLLVPLARRRRGSPAQGAPAFAGAAAPPPSHEGAEARLRLGWGAALAVALAVGATGAGLFALRAGAALAIAALVLLRAGVGERALFALAAAGIALVPLLYLASPVEDEGGYSFNYSNHHIEAHWVAVGAVSALIAGCLLAAWRTRRRAGPGRPPT